MNCCFKFLLIFCGLLLTLTAATYSGVYWGVKEFDDSAWDFSDTTSIYYRDPRADIGLSYTSMSTVGEFPLGFYVTPLHRAKLAILPDSIFEDLRYAPPDSSPLYTYSDICVMLNKTYVVITTEGHYAKFRFLQPDNHPLNIEYVYQPDGSNKLFDPIGTMPCSWSRIKSLFW